MKKPRIRIPYRKVALKPGYISLAEAAAYDLCTLQAGYGYYLIPLHRMMTLGRLGPTEIEKNRLK